MTTTEKILAEVDKLAGEQLEDLFILVQHYVTLMPKKTVSFRERLS